MKIYSSTSGDGTLYFLKLSEARAEAKLTAQEGGIAEVSLNLITDRLSAALVLQCIRGGGWANEIIDIEQWEPYGEPNDEGIWPVRCVQKSPKGST